MAFQRSYSKVWWGSDYNQSSPVTAIGAIEILPPAARAKTAGNMSTVVVAANIKNTDVSGSYASKYLSSMHFEQQLTQQQDLADTSRTGSSGAISNNKYRLRQQQHEYHSLDYHNLRGYGGNLSRIQEVDDVQNISKLSWEKRHSPGSLRSQDSGFSDNDESHSTRSLGGRTSKPSSPNSKSNNSRSSEASNSPCSSPSSASIATPPTVVRRVGRSQFFSPLVSVSRRISFNGTLNLKKESAHSGQPNAAEPENESEEVSDVEQIDNSGQKQKRRKRVSRQVTKPLSPNRRCLSPRKNDSTASNDNAVPAYNNETVHLGASFLSDGKEQEKLGNSLISFTVSPLRSDQATSTPNKHQKPTSKQEACFEYENPLLNGHSPALQHWLLDLQSDCELEVMSTLQTKSIAQEAFKNLSITTNTVVKLIRQLQQRALYLQTDFERLERILNGEQQASLQDALSSAMELVQNVTEFTLVLERRSVFFTNSREERRRFEDQLDQIRLLTRDTLYSLEKQHYINVESLLDDVQVLYRNLESTIRMVYQKMMRVIVQSIENSQCDLMLRANINMIVTLANIDYEGLSSLTEAFIHNETVRALLLVCLDHHLSSVRALALRALAMICCEQVSIEQFCVCGGIEILRDILQVSAANVVQRGNIERREAVSLLTQITAAWHGPDHYVDGLKACTESIVEGLTQLVAETNCDQTLLLCAAALNNLSRIEITSHYSMMSNETISKLIEAVDQKENVVSIFLHEQIIGMLLNMSLNKKCHSHLANSSIINFITCAYETEFYKKYNTRAESEAQRRSVKAILHILARLVHDSNVLGVSIPLPAFFKVANAQGNATLSGQQSSAINDGDIEKNNTIASKLNLTTRCESYV